MFEDFRRAGKTETQKDSLARLQTALREADAVVIGAGSGLSTAAGYAYAGERFETYFSDFREKYGIADIYSGGFYPYRSLEEFWAWWSRHIWINRYAPIPKDTYEKLFETVKDRDYFVLTTNVDHCFQRAGFDKERLFYTQGDYGLWQCSRPCHPKTYDNEETVRHLLKTQLYMAEGRIASLKWRPDGISLNGAPVHTNVRVRAGDVLTVRIDDGERGNPAAPIPVPLAVAKNAYASERLRRCLHTEDFVRDYLALAAGRPQPASGTIDLPLGPAEGERFRRAVRLDGQPAVTDYETLGAIQGGSLQRLRLQTGRTHQIRAHLAAVGHPLFGDALYGGPAAEGLDRPALHAAALCLRQPVTGARLAFSSPLPEDLRAFLAARGASALAESVSCFFDWNLL